MKESYFPEKGIWLKGNLHSHSTVSDGQFTPLELASQYAAAGYDFLSMTDHNLFVTHNELPEEKIILLTGVEHDIEYSADRCTHVVGIGDPCKEKTDYLCRRYSAAEKSDQQLIDMMQADGQFVTIAHPVWSRSELDDILALDNYHAIEYSTTGRSIFATAAMRKYYGICCFAMVKRSLQPLVMTCISLMTYLAVGSLLKRQTEVKSPFSRPCSRELSMRRMDLQFSILESRINRSMCPALSAVRSTL